MTSSSPSQPRLLPLLAVVATLLVLAIVWLADPFAPTTPNVPSVAGNTNDAALQTGTRVSVVDENQTAQAAPSARSHVPVAANRARMTGRVVLGDTPLPAATVRLAEDPTTTTTTANDGVFWLDVSPGKHHLAIAGAGTPRNARWGPVTIAPGQTFALGDVVVPLPASVRGRIVDEHGGPIADALVVSGFGGSAWAADRADRQSPDFAPHAVSDADGLFRIAGLSPHESSLQVERAGYQYGWQPYELAAGQHLDLGLVVLNTRAALRGVVFGPNGAPLAGARVIAGGTENDPLRQRSAVTTDARGTFVLDPRSSNDVTVFAEGCEPSVVRHESEATLHVTMTAAHVLRGNVAGAQGRPGVVRVDRVPTDYTDHVQWLQEVFAVPVPIANDGTFVVPCLPAGQWQCVADVPGVGRSAFVVITVPSPTPIRLELLAQRTVHVVVQDDLGVAVPAAAVTASTKFPGAGEYQHTSQPVQLGHDGSARIDVMAGYEPTLACHSSGHAPVRRSLAPGENAVTVVLPRLGAVTGGLGALGYTAHCRLVVQAKSTEGTHVASVDADRDGRYCLPLAAGEYRIDVIAVDTSHHADRERPVAAPVPLVSDFEPLVASRPVTVRGGETTVADFAIPAFAEITGRVLVRGQPLANAIVYASTERARQRSFGGGPDRHRSFPNQRTDAAGAFRFLLSSGREVHLHARHGGSGEWSPILAVTVTSGERRVVDLALHAAAIRGRLDMTPLSLRQRSFLEARLCLVAAASSIDVGFFYLNSMPPAAWQPKCPVGPDGAFAFECLPPGGYVLRIGSSFEPDLLQRIVYTHGDEPHDLGLLAAPIRHPVKLIAEPRQPEARSVYAMLPTPGNALGVFAGEGSLSGDNLDLGELPAGTYHLLLLGVNGAWAGADPEPEATAEITVSNDGTVTPARVTFTAKK